LTRIKMSGAKGKSRLAAISLPKSRLIKTTPIETTRVERNRNKDRLVLAVAGKGLVFADKGEKKLD